MGKQIDIELSDIDSIVDILKGGTVQISVEGTTVSLKLAKESIPEDDEEALELIESLWDNF